jgi:hypothetical protein
MSLSVMSIPSLAHGSTDISLPQYHPNAHQDAGADTRVWKSAHDTRSVLAGVPFIAIPRV